MSYRILNKDWKKQSHTLFWVNIYCDHYVRLTLFCISLAWIESNFVFRIRVSYAIYVVPLEVGVGVGYQVCPKDDILGSNSATLRDMTIH